MANNIRPIWEDYYVTLNTKESPVNYGIYEVGDFGTTNNNNVVYERIVKSQKRDRATSLAYGLSVIQSMELYNIKNVMDEEDVDDELIYF